MNALEIQNRLIGNGHIILENKRKGQSLCRADRSILDRNRQTALASGMTWRIINTFEMDGMRGVKGMIAPEVEAEFRFIDRYNWPVGFRMYDIKGDHPQNGSTVGVMKLVHDWILPRDLNALEIAFHYANETVFIAWCVAAEYFYAAKNFLRREL